MSLINDALKQARKGPPENTPAPLQQLQPAASEPNGLPAWLWPTVIILLVVAAIFFIGWAVTHRGQPAVVTAPAPAPVVTASTPAAPATPPPAPVPATPAPSAQTPAAVPPPVAQPATVAPPFVLKLQGIDYLGTAPSAILNGKTVHPGDTFREYRVKSISSRSITLTGPDNKDTVVEMEN